jgi:hypothetical protein
MLGRETDVAPASCRPRLVPPADMLSPTPIHLSERG